MRPLPDRWPAASAKKKSRWRENLPTAEEVMMEEASSRRSILFAGLLARIPKAGNVWPETERKLWLELLEGSFKLIYKGCADD
jgi:hypothetical protein